MNESDDLLEQTHEPTKRDYANYIYWTIAIALTISIGALLLYSTKFSKGLSSNSGDWGNFGSYFGGLMSPVISLLTLIAILVTITIQKKLIDQQNIQISQLEYSSRSQKVSAHKQIILNEIHQQANNCRSAINTLFTINAETNKTFNTSGPPLSEIEKENHQGEIQENEAKIRMLMELSLDLSLKHFDEIIDLDIFYCWRMNKIFKRVKFQFK